MNVVTIKRKGIVYLHWLNGITTFSFAVLLSSLSLYLTKQIGLSQTQSNGVVAFFIASNFILHFIAGYIGDKMLSNRLLFAISMMMQTLGAMVLNHSHSFIYLGLSLFLIGCGLGATCINCLITQQFDNHEDELREKAFFYNYSAMNIGFLSGYVLSGFIDIKGNYGHLFEVSNIANVITLFIIIKSWKYFAGKSSELNQDIKKEKANIRLILPKILGFWHRFLKYRTHKNQTPQKPSTSYGVGVLCIILMIPIIYIGFYHSWLANCLILTTGISALLYTAFIGYNSTVNAEKGTIYSFVLLTSASIIFWMLYFVGPMGVTQFLKYNVSIYIGNYYIPPQWIMNLNSIFVIIGSPIMLLLFEQLRNRNIPIPISRQFVFSLLFIALSFFMLSMGILNSNPEGITGVSWIIMHYLLQSIGELLIAPVGYAMIGHLAPTQLQGLMMGIWMMASGISATLSHYFSNIMTQSESVDPLISNEHYINAFTQLGLYALLGGLVLWLGSKTLEHSIKKKNLPLVQHPLEQ